jgi:hypothetical protein
MAGSTFQGTIRSLSGMYVQGPAAVVNVSTATLTLDPTLHAGRILNITAATSTITLPAVNATANPVSSGPGQDPNTMNNLGVLYTFVLPTAATAVKVVTGASDFMIGGVDLATSGGAANSYTANGTTIRSINLNGTTTGGIGGSTFTLVAFAANLYLVQGQIIGSGTLATPFATS